MSAQVVVNFELFAPCDVLVGLKFLPDNSIDCVVCSPPYWGLRDYGVEGQLGLERTPFEYIARMVEVFREIRRVLKPSGTLWLNIGDSYTDSGRGADPKHLSTLTGTCRAQEESRKVKVREIKRTGFREKNLWCIPWRLAIALQDDGWNFRRDIIWHKPNAMPESATDRPTTAHEYVFLFSKSSRATCWRNRKTGAWAFTRPDLKERITVASGASRPLWQGFDYFYDADAIKEATSLDSHDRMARGRGHGYCPPGQHEHCGSILAPRKKVAGWQDGAGLTHRSVDHAKPGVNPKAVSASSKFRTNHVPGARDPQVRQNGATEPDIEGLLGPKGRETPGDSRSSAGERFGRGAGWRNKQNPSFSAAVVGRVEWRNARSVWSIPSRGYHGAHFATYPEELVRRCIAAGCPEGGVVLDPFAGSGTTLSVALALGRSAKGIELNPEYIPMIKDRIASVTPGFVFSEAV